MAARSLPPPTLWAREEGLGFASHGAGSGDRRDAVCIFLCLSSPWLSRPCTAPPRLDNSNAMD